MQNYKMSFKSFLEIFDQVWQDFWYTLTFSLILYAVTSPSCNTAYIEDGSVKNIGFKISKKQPSIFIII